MTFDKIYNECKAIIITILRNNDKFGDAEEFLNSAYLLCIENDLEPTKNNLIAQARKSIQAYDIGRDLRRPEFGKAIVKRCIKCNEGIPFGYFGLTSFNGKQIVQPYCRDCSRAYFKEYWLKRKDLWNQMLRDRYRKEANELHDNYIKKVLRVYGWKTEKITPQVIAYKRREILQKRENKNRNLVL